MKVKAIIANKEYILFEMSEDLANQQMQIREFFPLLNETCVNDADKEEVAFEHNYIKIRRFIQKRDRIILSEQGFNSKGDSFSEKQGAAAFCLAFQKVKKLNTIDMMTHHAYVDNPYEFGLNLGIRRRNADGSIGEPKPIYYVMRDMDTEQEEQRISEARSFIGEELFDALLNPVITYGEADNHKESEFQEINTEEEGDK